MSNIINLSDLSDKEELQPVLFGLTGVYITNGVQYLLDENIISELELNILLLKHVKNIDDNKYEEDRKYNLEAIKTGTGRVLSVYELNGHRFYINSYVSKKGSGTIADETMIMLCDEY